MKYLINSEWLYVGYKIDFSADHNCYKNIKTMSHLGDIDALVVNHQWRTLDLPHDYGVEREFDPTAAPVLGFKRPGHATYMRFFDLPQLLDGESVILEFEGIMGRSDVYFNGTHVKSHRSGYTGFFVDVTDYVVNGVRNTLCVCVDGDTFEGWWYEGAGIYRNVYVHVKRPLSFSPLSVFFKPKRNDDDTWQLSASATVCNSFDDAKNACLELSFTKDGEVVKTHKQSVTLSHGENKIEFSCEISSPALWSPENPELYSATLDLFYNGESYDTQKENVGFRYFSLDSEKGLFLNGNPYKIKGIVCHQDHAGVGVALTDDIIRYRIQKMKDLGCNGYRSAHHSASPALMRVCDELGMLILDENRHFDSSEDSMAELDSLVLYGRNHPSVYCYSLFNEEPIQANCVGARIARRMKNAVLALDDSRFISGAMHTDILTGGSVSDEFTLVGANYQMHLFDDFHTKNPKKNIMATENACVFATRGIYETDKQKHFFSEYGDEVAAWGMSLEDTWQIVVERPFVVSAFMWCGFDYRGEPCPFYALPSVSTHWGITDTCGFEKSTYYMLQCCYKDTPVVHIIKNYKKSDAGYSLTVISNCDKVCADVNGALEYFECVGQYRYEIRLPEMPHSITVSGKKGDASASDTYTLASDGRQLRLSRFGNIINVEMTDKHGNLILDDAEISFKVDGGYVTGVGNGNPVSTEPDYAQKRRLFSGKCQMHLRPTSEQVTVYACSDKGEESELSYTAELCNEPALPAIYELYASAMMMYRNEYDGELRDFEFNSRDMNNYSVATSRDAYTEGRHIYALRLNIDGNRWKLLFSGVKSPVTIYESGTLTTLDTDGEYSPLGDEVILIENTCRDSVGGFDIPVKIAKKQ